MPDDVRTIAAGLQYRDFMTVGLLTKKLKLRPEHQQTRGANGTVPDNWIYIQEPDVKVGRLQIFNNWSPYMVADPDKVWIGLEYFCNEGDELWTMEDKAFAEFAIRELAKIDIVDPADVVDHTVIRVPKTYPSYSGSYTQFDKLRAFTDTIREPLPDRPQRHAPLQQPGPLDAHRDDGRRQPGRGPAREEQHLADQYGRRLPRREDRAPRGSRGVAAVADGYTGAPSSQPL